MPVSNDGRKEGRCHYRARMTVSNDGRKEGRCLYRARMTISNPRPPMEPYGRSSRHHEQPHQATARRMISSGGEHRSNSASKAAGHWFWGGSTSPTKNAAGCRLSWELAILHSSYSDNNGKSVLAAAEAQHEKPALAWGKAELIEWEMPQLV